MRVLFAGSPGIAVPSLMAVSAMETEGAGGGLYGESIELAGILTNPDSARGRSGKLEPTEVSAAASKLSARRLEMGFSSIIQLKFQKLDAAARVETAALKADLLVSFAYGRIFGPKFLSLFRLGGINIHPSLLPRYRGPAPIPAAILGRDGETGLSIQELALEMDSGAILAQQKMSLTGRETAFSLSEEVAVKAARMLPGVFRGLMTGTLKASPQEGEAVYCGLVEKSQGLINWNMSAEDIDALVRAYTPWPLAFTHRGSETLYILEGRAVESSAPDSNPGTVIGIDRERGILIQTGNGIYAVSRLQWQTKKALNWKDFLNGTRDFPGSVLV